MNVDGAGSTFQEKQRLPVLAAPIKCKTTLAKEKRDEEMKKARQFDSLTGDKAAGWASIEVGSDGIKGL